ncbi:MAG: exodeoxyribonuclease III [Alphaproteobacteria bacterium]|nr:exodeoxyribonuclease III [Alphaproteobacteria bacterium]
MRICTWNINSVRLRAPIVQDLMRQHEPDIVCLQETKTPNDKFPHDAFTQLGYNHHHIDGIKGYNGVAILSKRPLKDVQVYSRVDREDGRHISAAFTVDGFAKPIEVHCIYIPAGGDEPDREINDKFAHKLDFVAELENWFSANHSDDKAMIALGDFNIAPLEHDVWSHKQLLKIVSHTPIEVEALTKMQKSIDWVDALRHFIPEDEKCYTWWSYRNRDWRKSNRGRRLDHIWVTPDLKPHLKAQDILLDMRDVEKPSDHVPVFVDFNFA